MIQMSEKAAQPMDMIAQLAAKMKDHDTAAAAVEQQREVRVAREQARRPKLSDAMIAKQQLKWAQMESKRSARNTRLQDAHLRDALLGSAGPLPKAEAKPAKHRLTKTARDRIKRI